VEFYRWLLGSHAVWLSQAMKQRTMHRKRELSHRK
jgi:hypothetical protein